jgi:uncharacterized protein (DUF433 family)
MDEHPAIYFRDGAAGRRPALLGTRLDVADVMETIRQNDRSVERAAAYLELPVDRVEACLRYYADYADEVDEWIDRTRAIADREEARWQRRGQALAWSCSSTSTTRLRSPDSSAPAAMTSSPSPNAPT